MKRVVFLLSLVILLAGASRVYAQGMPALSGAEGMGGFNDTNSQIQATVATTPSGQDEQAGSQIWQNLQNKQTTCSQLKNDDFDKLGDFFMGRMMGSSHDFMDQMMTQRLGESGNTQMHIALGERLSGCNTNAQFPQNGQGFLPMMGGMMGSFGGMMGGWGNGKSWRGGGFPMGYGGLNNMMGGNFGLWSVFCFLTWLVLFIFLLLGIVYFWKEINKPEKK